MEVKSEILKHQAKPGCSMFSYNLETGVVEFVATVFFHPKEIKKGTIKYYLVPRQEGKVYIQAHTSIEARQRIRQFLNKQQNEKSKSESNQIMP